MKKAVLRDLLNKRYKEVLDELLIKGEILVKANKEDGSLDFKEVKPKRTRKPKGEK